MSYLEGENNMSVICFILALKSSAFYLSKYNLFPVRIAGVKKNNPKLLQPLDHTVFLELTSQSQRQCYDKSENHVLGQTYIASYLVNKQQTTHSCDVQFYFGHKAGIFYPSYFE